MRVLCAPLSLTSFLISLEISPLAPPFSLPPCAQSLLHLFRLPPLPVSLPPPVPPFPLTCRLPPQLGVYLLLPLSAHLSSAPSAGGLPPAPPSSQSLPFPPLASSSLPPPPGFPYPPSSAFSVTGSSMVHGLGVGVPPSSGVPPSPLGSSAAHAYAAATPAPAPAWPPAYPPDPYAPSAPLASSDPLADDDGHFPDDVHDPLDPSAPPLSLDSARSEYRRTIDYVCDLFPQAAGVPPSAPPPHALFESFFAPSAPSIQLNWFDRVRTSLVELDSRVAALLTSSRPKRLVLPQRLGSYTVRGDCTLGRAVPVNESLLSHFERPLHPTLQMGVTVRDAMALEASCCVQSEALFYSMWVLTGLLGFVRLQDFNPADPALFHQLVTALSKSLAHQAQITASHTTFLCHRRREFYLSHLPAYFSDVSKRSMLSSPAVFADSLFREEDVSHLLEATRSSSSLKSQQAMVNVASCRPSSSPSFRQRRGSPSRSPHRSPAKRRRQSSASPSRASKWVRFDSPAPSSTLKSPHKSHFRD